jgi:CRP-like cAMP-binding protein
MKEQDIDKITRLIYEAPIGEYIGRDGAAVLAAHAGPEQRLKDGEFLFRRGDSAPSFYLVKEGYLAFVRERDNGGEVIVHILEKGDLVGELSFIDQMPHTLSVRALGEASVQAFNMEDFEPLITEHPLLIYNFMRAILKRSHHIIAAIGEQEMELRRYITTRGRGRN